VPESNPTCPNGTRMGPIIPPNSVLSGAARISGGLGRTHQGFNLTPNSVWIQQIVSPSGIVSHKEIKFVFTEKILF
jgi:hypothetical protein